MRIFTASLATETNTFATLPTGLQAFRDGVYFPAGTHPDSPSFFGGPLWAARLRAREHGWTVIEGLVAAAYPSGITTRDAYETLRDEILAQLRAALPVDIIALGLHGAMVATGYEDCEGDLLARVREIAGNEVALGATLDPHGHISDAMLRSANLLISWKEYPHTDINDRALELIDLLVRKARGSIEPSSASVDCGMICTIFTTREPGRSLVNRMHELEQRPGILSVSLNHGFPWGDVPQMGTKVMVYTNADPGLAANVAREMADSVIAVRDELHMDFPDIDAALDAALASNAVPVVISDGADNAGGGASSDSTWFLERMLERGIRNAAVGGVWDPCVVASAFEAGLGQQLQVCLGGKSGPLSGKPLNALATVTGLARQHTMRGLLEGQRFDCGDSALLDIEGIEVAVISKRMQPMGTDLFTGLGCELDAKRIIVVKSSQHFHAEYAPIAGCVLYARAPGVITHDLDSLDYRRITRPRWPIAAERRPTPEFPALPAQSPAGDWIEEQILALARRSGAVVGVYAREMDGPRRIEYQADHLFPMASTCKVALAAALLSRIDAGNGSLDDMIDVEPGHHVMEGVISMMFPHRGMRLSIANLLEVMMADSDNTATDRLFEYVGGPPAVTQWLRSIGIQVMRVDRTTDRILRDAFSLGNDGTNMEAARRYLSQAGMTPAIADEFSSTFENDTRDTTSPRAMADLITALLSGAVLSAGSLELLTGMMRRAQTQRHTGIQRLRARAPDGALVARKGGTAPGVINDVGWIDLPGGRRIVAAVYTRHGVSPREKREKLVEEIGRLVYACLA